MEGAGGVVGDLQGVQVPHRTRPAWSEENRQDGRAGDGEDGGKVPARISSLASREPGKL
jgi:hypothetical protein